MSIPITIDTLLNENIVEWARIEFKESWNPDAILKTISAFANDIDNWGGGYIVIGAQDNDGELVTPVKGVSPKLIDKIQKELLQYCKYLNPTYIPNTQPVKYQGVMLLLIWVPGGYERPYRCPKKPSIKNSEKVYYIRKLSSTILATDSEINELISLSRNIPFDDRVNMNANITDLKHPTIRNYLSQVKSSLFPNSDAMSVEELAKDLRIANGTYEYFKPLNVGLLLFNDNPENFFPYTRIEIVNIPDPTGQGMEERIFTGPIDQQLRDALLYIKNNVIAEKVFKIVGEAEADRYFNYSYEAVEEFLSNAVYHKSYQIHEPITVRIESDRMEITSMPGPDRSITIENIEKFQMRARRYRNRRIGDFLKEMQLIEGRNTGIPTALKAIEKNKSPLPVFLTDEERTFFSVIMKIHPSFIDKKNIKEKRRYSKEEIKERILEKIAEDEKTLVILYSELGYSGNPSTSFRTILKELIDEGMIVYDNPKNIKSSRIRLTTPKKEE